MKAELHLRTNDKYGSGDFNAPRGNHKHRGIDYACYAGTVIFPFYPGKVTKIGYPYADDLSYRYIQITDSDNRNWRYFYIDPMVVTSEYVDKDTPIGFVQSLNKRYEGITEHCHLEIKLHGEYLDPREFV